MTAGTKTLDCDVLVLGSGLAGSIAALCLVRSGLRVVLLDQGTHPRFALGESTTTPASLWLRVLAERFRAPELLAIASAEALARNVAATSGIKTNFGFLWHPPGGERPTRAWQAVIPPAFLGDRVGDRPTGPNEMHYFRQDVDAYLWTTALAAGAVGRPATNTAAIEFTADHVDVLTTAGETLRARFVIDASGYRSPIADRLGLRDEPPRARTNSRSLFTHMVGVTPFEATGLVPDSMAPWSQGTLHHIFDGGWIWVIPFDNHRESTNRLCSVGLNLDNRRAPRRPGVDADTEWRECLAAHPAIARQFERAVPVRPWNHTGRLQYTSRACVGDRFWLTSHAAATVDALYSFGNINTFQTLAVGLPLVVQACRDDAFERDRFAPMQRLSEHLHRFQDRIVYGNYASFRSPRLLATWIALWSLTDTARIRSVLMPLVRHARTGDPRDLDACLTDPDRILTGIGMRTGITDTPTVLDQLDALCDIMQELDEGRSSIDATAARLEAAVQARSEYAIDLAEMERAFTQMPWSFGPLARRGLRAHGTCFLTPHEMNTLGL